MPFKVRHERCSCTDVGQDPRQLRDEDGRTEAAKKGRRRSGRGCLAAGLGVETNGYIHGIRIGTTSMINARLSAEGSQVLLGENTKTVDDWEYDPIPKEFRGLTVRTRWIASPIK